MKPLVPEWDWCELDVPENASFGDGVELYSMYSLAHFHSQRRAGLQIGSRTGVYSWTMFEVGPDGELWVGEECSLVGCVINTNSRVTIGDHVLIANQVVIADDPAPCPHDNALPTGEHPETTVAIGDNAWIGQRAVVLGGARLGTGVIVGAATVVDFDVPDYAIVAGSPARIVGWSRPAAVSTPS